MHPHLAALKQTGARTQRTGNVAGRQATGFDVARVTHAAQQALGSRRGFSLLETSHLGQLVAALEQGMEVPHVVLQRHRSLVREVFDKVAAADLVLRQAQFPSAARDQALQQIGRFRATSAAIGIDRRGVGEPGIDLDINLRRGVLPSQQRGIQDGRYRWRKSREVGAHVGVGVHTQCKKLAVLVHRHLGVAGMVAPMRVADKGLTAVCRPLDVAVQFF